MSIFSALNADELLKAARANLQPVVEAAEDKAIAALNAFAAFNQFLCTPAGQQFAQRVGNVVDDLFSKLGVHMIPQAPQPPKQ